MDYHSNEDVFAQSAGVEGGEMRMTPLERWKERTNDGRNLAGGWVHAKHEPPKAAQYEVRDHPIYGILTRAYGSWWHQSIGDDCDGPSGSWHREDGRYDWRGPIYGYCSVNWGSVMHQAANAGNEQAKRDIAKAVREWNSR